MKTFEYKINDMVARTSDSTPTSAQILADAGFEPTEDYSLIMRTAHGTKVIDSDKSIDDLNDDQREFFAFNSGIIFQFNVNSHSIFWGESKIDVEKIRYLGRVSEEYELILIREHENKILELGEELDLSGSGIEHLRTEKRQKANVCYTYFIDSTEYQTDKSELTGAQIVAKIPNWDSANSLVLEGDDISEPDEMIRPTDLVNFKNRTKPAYFTVVPPATFGML